MRLYLIRHAHALSEAENPARPLSPRGRQVAEQMARFLAPILPEDLEWIVHSPLVRSRESAEVLGDVLEKPDRLFESPDLLPEDDPSAAVARLRSQKLPLVFVGHEPHLGRLAAQLLCGDKNQPLLLLKKGAACCLRRVGAADAPWLLEWLVKPKLLEELRASEEG